MLKSITGWEKGTRWCGPSAISIITGQSHPVALALLKDSRAEREADMRIKGVSYGEMRRVLTGLGYAMMPESSHAGVTVAEWLRRRTPEVRQSTMLIVAGVHYIVVKGNYACDSWTSDPVLISKMPHRRKRMNAVEDCSAQEKSAGEVCREATPPDALIGVTAEYQRGYSCVDLMAPKGMLWTQDGWEDGDETMTTECWTEAAEFLTAFVEGKSDDVLRKST